MTIQLSFLEMDRSIFLMIENYSSVIQSTLTHEERTIDENAKLFASFLSLLGEFSSPPNNLKIEPKLEICTRPSFQSGIPRSGGSAWALELTAMSNINNPTWELKLPSSTGIANPFFCSFKVLIKKRSKVWKRRNRSINQVPQKVPFKNV